MNMLLKAKTKKKNAPGMERYILLQERQLNRVPQDEKLAGYTVIAELIGAVQLEEN
jgi:hypothetical protein